MVTLEQIKLLESKISRAINFVAEVTEENSRLKKRNEELEAAVKKLREEKTRVEEGIVSALGKLNQFEDAIERSLSSVKINSKPPKPEKSPAPAQTAASAPAVSQAQTVPAQTAAPSEPPVSAPVASTPVPAVSAMPAVNDSLSAGAPDAGEPPAGAKPDLPSAYTIDEDEEETEDLGEAELDIF